MNTAANWAVGPGKSLLISEFPSPRLQSQSDYTSQIGHLSVTHCLPLLSISSAPSISVLSNKEGKKNDDDEEEEEERHQE